MKRIMLAVTVTLAFASPASALTLTSPPPTTLQAHDAIHLVLDNFAVSFNDNGRVIIDKCHISHSWRVCPVTVKSGSTTFRFTARVRRQADDYIFTLKNR